MKVFKKLSECAEISISATWRQRITNDAAGYYRVIQMKDVTPEGIRPDNLYKTNLYKKSHPKLVTKDDILFVSRAFRGSAPYSVIADIDATNVIAAPAFYVLHVNKKLVRTEYLHWFLNSEEYGKKFYKKHAVGSSVLNIPKGVLAEMEVLLPSLEVQDQIIKLINAVKHEKEIMESLIKKRKTYIDEVIKQYME